MKLNTYVALKASNLGLSRTIEFMKEDKQINKMVITTNVYCFYRAKPDDKEPLTRKEQKMHFFEKGMDENEMVEVALMHATLSFLGLDVTRVQQELETVLGASKPVVKEEVKEEVKDDIKVTIGDTPIEKPVVKKKATRRRKKKVEVIEVKEEEVKEEPKPELPVEEDEFLDLGDSKVLVCFDKSNKTQAGYVSKRIAEKLGVAWKSDAKKKAKVSALLAVLSDQLCFNEDGSPTEQVDQIIDEKL